MESGRDWSTDEDDLLSGDNLEPGSSQKDSKKISNRKRKAGRLKSRITKTSKLKRNIDNNESLGSTDRSWMVHSRSWTGDLKTDLVRGSLMKVAQVGMELILEH